MTVLDALIAAITRAAEYNRNAEVAPIAVLWPDGAEQWRGPLQALRQHLPVLTLGDYDPEILTGPAIWIRAELARRADSDVTPVVYLPGISKDVLRNVEEAPNTIEPLVYLQYRGSLFVQPNGRDWTIAAFLQNATYGLGLTVDRSDATRTGLLSAAPRLLTLSVQDLQSHAGGIDAEFLSSLLVADVPKSILEWINDPIAARATFDDASWEAFSSQLKTKYKIDPERDGPSAAARKLGEAKVGSHWDRVWERFAEAPRRYPNIPNMLRGAKPVENKQRSLFASVEADYHWPQDNDEQENALREALRNLGSAKEQDARATILELEEKHCSRRQTVWAELEQAPLAAALRHLAFIAERTRDPLPAGSVSTMQQAYVEWGWEIDAAALDAVTEVAAASDREAVDSALQAIYTPWLWQSAKNFQDAYAGTGHETAPKGNSFHPGTCVLFADGLRYDLAARLTSQLQQRGITAELSASIGPLPGVTPSAKPAQSPVANRLIAGFALDTRGAETGTNLNQTSFKKLLADKGWQFVSRDGAGHPGPEALGWTEFGDIDSYGHGQTDDLPRQSRREIHKLHQRISELLDAGWRRVVVITDHGWLLTPRAMEKTDLPQHLTSVRKGRCARLTDGSETHLQSVAWYWDANVRIAIAPGISCFEDGKRYDHGGLSLQECVIPRITVTAAGSIGSSGSVSIADISWRGLRCTVELDGSSDGYRVDIRLRAGDPETSIVSSVRPVEEGGARVLVEDDIHEGAEANVVVLDSSGTPVAQRTLIVGGEPT